MLKMDVRIWHDHIRNDTEKLSIRFWSYSIKDMQSTLNQPEKTEVHK